MKKILGILIAGLLICGTVYSQQRIIEGKTIKKSERWSGVVVISGDVTIAKGARLVIDPGTRVLFEPETDKTSGGKDKTRSEIIVAGTLIARGSINNKIVFSSNASSQKMGDWYGIFISGKKQISILDYVTVEYAFDGLRIKNSSPQINNSQFRYNYNSGLLVDIKAKPKIISNIISRNGYAGIICQLGASPLLSENLITGNSIGLLIDGSSKPNLGNLQEGPNYNIGKNRLFDNEEYNIYNHGSKDIFAVNNFWGSESPEVIAEKIFDNNNDRKYGIVNYNPILGASRSDINDLIRMAQESPPTNQNAGAQSLAAAAGQNQGGGTINQNPPAQNNLAQTDTDLQSQTLAEQPEQAQTAEDQNLKHRTMDQILGTLAVEEEPEKEEPEPVAQPEVEKQKPPEIDYEQVFLDAFLDNGSHIVKKVAPVNNYGIMADGRVIVKIVVAKDGTVESSQVLKGNNDYINKLALDAANQFIYKPGTVNGHNVRFTTTVVFKF